MSDLFSSFSSSLHSQESPDWPLFPHCQHLTGRQDANEFYLTCLPIFKILGNQSSQIHIRNKLKKHHANQKEFELHQLTPNVDWNQLDVKWEPLDAVRDWDWMISVKDLKPFLTWALARTRKSKDEKHALFKKFNVDVDTDSLQAPIENECLSALAFCLPMPVQYQYRLGKYRLDAYIPRLHLAIQIDEKGHKGYDENDEKELDTLLRDHNMVCIRFNPDAHAPHPKFALIRQVWERTLSPDFTAFREKHKLV